MGRTTLQVLNGLLLVLFAAAAAVQYNDPDPWLWIIVYASGAVCCALYAVKWLPAELSGAIAAVCLGGALYLLIQIVFGPIRFLDETGQEMMGLMEQAREMIGALIVGLWTGVLTWDVTRRTENGPSHERTSA